MWSWDTVCHNSSAVSKCMASNPKKVEWLKFRNHRKLEVNNPASPVGVEVSCAAGKEGHRWF